VSEIERRRGLRQRFLELLYEASGGDTTGAIQMGEIAAQLGLGEQETEQIVQWLVDRDLVRWFSFGGNISITPAGVDAAEAASAEDAAAPRRDDLVEIDLFISHASEDKERFARPLVEELGKQGMRVWFDEAELRVGDSLTQKIDDGLRRSRYGVVILSTAFFAKDWPRAELDALADRQFGTGDVVILPIWLGVSAADVRAYSPLLASLFALRASEGVAQIAEKLAERVREARGGGLLTTGQPGTASSRQLDPAYLINHIQPWMSSPAISSDERALAIRAALAGAIKTSPAPYLTPRDQEAFEDAVAESSLERLLVDLTEHGGHRAHGRPWRRVDPTNTWIITLSRRSRPRVMYAEFSVEARASVSLRPVPGAGTGEWLILYLDVVIRPPGADDERSGGTPLSLDDFHSLLYRPLSALLEVAPAVLSPLNDGTRTPDILSVGCLLIANGGGLEDYLRLGIYASDRAHGASEPSVIQWFASGLDEIALPEARLATTRQLLERFFIDGGYIGYEGAIDRLTPE
jgi:TIR domain